MQAKRIDPVLPGFSKIRFFQELRRLWPVSPGTFGRRLSDRLLSDRLLDGDCTVVCQTASDFSLHRLSYIPLSVRGWLLVGDHPSANRSLEGPGCMGGWSRVGFKKAGQGAGRAGGFCLD